MLEAFFKPASIAVIGASPEQGKVGYSIVKNIIDSGFKGKIYPINPNYANVLGLTCYPNLLNVPESIDLGVVAVPARIVPSIVEDSGKKGLKGLIVISSGFKETGGEGAKLEREIIERSKRYNIRLLGPNCLGIIDTHLPLNTTFSANMPVKGNIAFVSQSGALGTAILDWTIQQGIGLSKFVSIGNKADVDETDIIRNLADDPNTSVILLYVEGVARGDAFIHTIKDVSRNKPVVALKSGITEAGTRAVSSHTGSMAGNDLAFSVAFKKAGVIRINTTEELFDIAKAFATQPIPHGANVVIITNAGGPGILATDACEKYGLRMAPISPQIVTQLRSQLPPSASFFNPIDLIGDAGIDRYRFALDTVLRSEAIHNALVILTPQATTEVDLTAKTLIEVHNTFRDKPLVASFMGGDAVSQAIKLLEGAKIPNYAFPERAIRALAALSNYGDYQRSNPARNVDHFEVDTQTVTSIFRQVVKSGRLVLMANEANEVANAYGILVPSIQLATTADEAVDIAERIGYPLVMKIESPNILHKTDIGGVKMNIKTPDDVRTSFYELIGRANAFYPRATILGVNVQEMVPSGKETIVGMTRDVTFGPLLMFGLGGIYVNFMKDVAFELTPLSREEAWDMVKETKAYTLLRGVRGERGSDIDSVINVLLRMSQLVSEFPTINEFDINPLFVYEKGCIAIDVKITIKNR